MFDLKKELGTKKEFESARRLREFNQMQDREEFEELRDEDINNDNQE